MMTDIEIAQSVQMKHISEIAKTAGIPEQYLEQYGNYKAKIDLAALKEGGRDGKLILVTAITPTAAGEGKTTTTIGLADGMRRIGKNTMVALREPRWVLYSASKAVPQAADTHRSFRWRTLTSISRVTSMPSVPQTICWPLCWTITSIKVIR